MKRSPRSGMFRRLVLRSLQRRWRRLAVAAVAVLLGALLVASLSTLTLDIGSKIGKELRAYGANILVIPRDDALSLGSGALDFGNAGTERFLSEADLAPLGDTAAFPEVVGYAPYLYGVVQAQGSDLILAGTRLERARQLAPWWKIEGALPETNDRAGAAIGVNVARQLGLAPGDALTLSRGARAATFSVRGVVDGGGSEDSQVLVDLAVAQDLLERAGAVAVVPVSAQTDNRSISVIADGIRRALPSAQVKIVGQIADAEAAVFFKVQLLLALVAALVLLAAALAVGSTMATSVLERTREIGLLKALGASGMRIGALFLSESAVVGFAGGVAGFGLGLAVAALIAQSVFGTALRVHWLALPMTVGIALVVALIASVVPVRRAVGVDPAVTLRGE